MILGRLLWLLHRGREYGCSRDVGAVVVLLGRLLWLNHRDREGCSHVGAAIVMLVRFLWLNHRDREYGCSDAGYVAAKRDDG